MPAPNSPPKPINQGVDILLNGKRCLAWHPAYRGNDRANGYWCPVGERPGVAYVYMLFKDALQLPLTQAIILTFRAGKAVSFPLWFDTATCASGGAPGDPDRAYLVRLVDCRAIFKRLTATSRAFNVRCPAPPTLSIDGTDPQEFYKDSLNPLTDNPYSWAEAAEALWFDLPPTLVNTFPGLPFAPDGIPQNLRYQGVNSWDALHDLLGKLNCTTAYDPITDTFRIVELGATQPGLAAAQDSYPLQIENADPISSTITRLPEEIRVTFHKQAQHFGTENDTPQDANWVDDGALYDVYVPGTGIIEDTQVQLFDDLPAIVDFNGNVTNKAALQTRAEERAETWIEQTVGLLERNYVTLQGVAPEFMPGEQITGIWYRDVGDGMLTELARYPEPPVPPWEYGGAASSEKPSENFQGPDFARHTTPTYPRNLQLIQLQSTVADANGLMAANVIRCSPKNNFAGSVPAVELQQVWAAETTPGARRRRNTCSIYYGRLNGTAMGENEQALPLYLLDSGVGEILLGKATQDIDRGKSGTVNIWDGPPGAEVDTGITVQLTNIGPPLFNGDWLTLTVECTGPRMIIAPLGQVLGKAFEDIKYGNSGKVRVFKNAGSLGSEESTASEFTAQNYFCGIVARNHWTWCSNTTDGWYIVAAEGGVNVYGQVAEADVSTTPPKVNATLPGGTVQVTIWENGNATNTTITAAVEHAPIFSGEFVSVHWTGKQFIIGSGDYDGGINAVYNSLAPLPKGSASSAFKLQIYPQTAPTSECNFDITCRLGQLPAGPKEVRISRDANGVFVTAAEC